MKSTRETTDRKTLELGPLMDENEIKVTLFNCVCCERLYIYTCSKNDKGNKMILFFLLYVMSSQIDVEDIPSYYLLLQPENLRIGIEC